MKSSGRHFAKRSTVPTWSIIPTYATNALRVKHRAAFEAILFDLFRTRPAEEWLKRLKAAGVPCSLVRNLREVVEDPQSEFRGMFPMVESSDDRSRIA